MGKHAYLVIAHNDWALLNKLLEILDDKRNSIFIHIDKKADFPVKKIYVPQQAECRYLKRQKVTWGGWSMIRMELELLRTATAAGSFDYLHLLSGQDLPLKTADEIFLQTIAYNSQLKETIVNDALREIDWMRGNPYVYTSEDEELLRNSPKLFARKFSTHVDAEIIESICQHKEYGYSLISKQ